MSDVESTTPDTPVPAPKRRWLVPLVLIVVVGGGAGGAWYAGLIGGAAEDGDAAAVRDDEPRIYFTLADNLVVNFRSPGSARYLQVGIDLMTSDAHAVEAFEEHAPALRNNLILLLSDQSYEGLSTREGKEALRESALAEVRAVLEESYGSPAVDELYFTSFVMQ